jgi:hypothetical protein
MVERFRLTNAKNVSVLMDPHVQYSIKQCPSTLSQMEQIKGVPYSKAIGSILWPTVVSRPDTAYAVGILSQFMQNPGQVQLDTVKCVMNVSFLFFFFNMCLPYGFHFTYPDMSLPAGVHESLNTCTTCVCLTVNTPFPTVQHVFNMLIMHVHVIFYCYLNW